MHDEIIHLHFAEPGIFVVFIRKLYQLSLKRKSYTGIKRPLNEVAEHLGSLILLTMYLRCTDHKFMILFYLWSKWNSPHMINILCTFTKNYIFLDGCNPCINLKIILFTGVSKHTFHALILVKICKRIIVMEDCHILHKI